MMRRASVILAAALLSGCGCADGPDQLEVVIEPAAPTAADALTTVVTWAGDDVPAEVLVGLRWQVDGADVDDLTEESVPAGRTTEGETWRVIATPTRDGVEGRAAVDEVVISAAGDDDDVTDDDSGDDDDDSGDDDDSAPIDLDGDGVPVGEDCDDEDPANFPGNAEVCDGADNDCNELADADPDGEVDGDGDGALSCADPDDTDDTVYPGAPELCDGLDNDGDGSLGPDEVDGDGDGFLACEEADDTNDTVYPGAPELCDGLDNDGNGTPDADPDGEVDADGDGSLSCEDCDDADDANFPGNAEACDGADNDCDVTTDAAGGEGDADGDGSLGCADCDDGDATSYPGAPELCDGLDNDCDTVITGESDGDGDGFLACEDCVDSDDANFPGNPEVCDGQDNNCNGVPDFDADGEVDGDGDGALSCEDCDDDEDEAFPGNPEVCGDSIDNDCDGDTDTDTDADGDSYFDEACGGTDCDDADDTVYPGAPDPDDGIDQDCDGDPDGADAWSELSPAGDTLPASMYAAGVWDPVQGRVLLVGGQTYYDLLDGVFAYDPATDTVTELAVTGGPPPARLGHTVVVDTDDERLLLFGGQGFYDLYADVWALDLSVPAGAWTQLAPTGTPPAARAFHAAAYDPTFDRMVVYGGTGFHDTYGDTWELDLGTTDGAWTELLPSGDDPLPRTGHGYAYDAGDNRLFIGGGATFHDLGDSMYVWELSNGLDGVWNEVTPSLGTPDPVVAGAWAWDPLLERVVQIGGQTWHDLLLEPQAVQYNQLGQPEWFGLAPAGDTPPARRGAVSVYDPDDNVLYLVGGQTHYDLLADVWALEF